MIYMIRSELPGYVVYEDEYKSWPSHMQIYVGGEYEHGKQDSI